MTTSGATAAVPWLAGSAVAGLFAHHSFFIRGEWHMYVPNIVFGHVVLAVLTLHCVPVVAASSSGDQVVVQVHYLRLCTGYVCMLSDGALREHDHLPFTLPQTEALPGAETCCRVQVLAGVAGPACN